MKERLRLLLLFGMLASLVMPSCSRKKNSFTRRAYHNTTSHYNYYFNARELVRNHVNGYESIHVDDYNYLLPIFVYATEEQSNSAYDDMEEVIKKCSRLIDRHSIYIKKDEFNRWVDQSYILVGRAKFYKREYYGAIEVLEYVTYAFKGKPSYFEAQLWIVRCYIQMEDFYAAEDVLNSMSDGSVPDELKGEYYALWSDLTIKEGDHEKAIPYLLDAIKFTREKKLKRRYTYILAQIYHELRNYGEATKYYGKVLKMRPDYKMAFNARLNQARSYDPSANNSADIKKKLNRMLRDKKNLEFRDQIYFALAELAFREGDEALGIEYLRKSASSSVNNNKVKSEAYMLLGDIYYDKPEYIPAHGYYDSALVIIPENHRKYEVTKERKESLDDLVKNLLLIQREDSLQKLAAMNEKDREKVIAAIIKKVERDEELERQALQQGFALSYQTAVKTSTLGGGKWYFYNVSTRSFGVSDFQKRWGDRPLEDNWRRIVKNKELKFAEDAVLQDSTQVADSTEGGITNKDPEFYMQQIPLTDSALQASHAMIIEALYDCGNIYREQFKDYRNAIASFERLIKDYDTSQYVGSVYYQLYRIYLIIEDAQSAARYRDKIMTEFPFSEYARIINNPEYLKNKRDAKEQVEAYYKASYQLYQYRLYEDVIAACVKADSLFGEHHLKPQFSYLKALAIGKGRDKNSFRQELEAVVANYPGQDVAKAAQEILNKMDEMKDAKEEREKIYKKNFRDEHVLVVMVPNLSNKVEEVKIAISNYNLANAANVSLKVSAVVFNGELQMVSVKNFKNKDEGASYLVNLSEYPEFESTVKQPEYDYFLISSENFAYFYQQKNVEDYVKFYRDNYGL